jgi:hypothetical protein
MRIFFLTPIVACLPDQQFKTFQPFQSFNP